MSKINVPYAHASSIFEIVSSTVISIVFAIYIIAQKETLIRQLDKMMKAYLKPKIINKMYGITLI